MTKLNGDVLWIVAAACAATTGPAGAQTVLHEFEGQAPFDFLGWFVDGAGDVDADGHADLIVGLLGYSAGSRALVFSGDTGALLLDLPVASVGGVAGAGDVDLDGHADVIVGDIGGDAFGRNTGRALVFSGRTGALLHAFDGSAEDDFFGTSVSGAGDVDGDGFDDLVVGAPQPDTFNPGTGYARVFSGLSGALLHDLVGDSPGDAFGRSVSGAGDVDGDGFADVIVGASGDDDNGPESGSARVFSGSTGAVLHDFDGGAAGDRLGQSVSGLGDVDADGFDDVIVGVPRDSTLHPSGGSVRVYSGLDGTVLLAFFGDAGDYFGNLVGDAGDVDGDCVPDLIAASGGGGSYARVLSGAGGTIFTVTGLSIASVAGAGDVDRDGAADVIVGDPAFSGPVLHEIGLAIVYAGPAGTVAPYCSPAMPNSTGAPGVISTAGSVSVIDDCLALRASSLPAGQAGYFLGSLAQGLFMPPGSSGVLCLGGAIGRFNQPGNVIVGPTGSIPLDLTALPQPNGHLAVQPGDTWNFQCWYRDLGNTNNFTDAISVTFL